jgi:hypothetical protein
MNVETLWAVGDRLAPDVGGLLLEWTDERDWAPVCAADDVAMVARTGTGHLCCGVCRGLAPDVARRA